jgi:formate dehydrogenase major subunit
MVDHNRCILCRRCVRACGELVGNFTWGMQERGADTILVADLNVPAGESTCVSCGTCVQVCPTGAIIDRLSAYQGRDTDVEHIQSTCAGCSVGCGIDMIVRDNRLLRINGNWEAPVNQGLLCEVGRFLPLKEERPRILTPLVRKNGSLKAATWSEAFETIAAKLKPLAGKNGDGVAALASTRLPVEALHRFANLFATQFGSDMVTSIEEGVTTALSGSVAQKSGRPFEGGLEALKKTDCVVAIGVDLFDNHQVPGFFIKRVLPNGTRLVVVDPFENSMFERADYPLQPEKGTDYDLLMGLMAGLVELELAESDDEHLPDLAQHTPDKVSQTTGIPADTILEVAKLLAAAEKPVFVYGKGVTRSQSPEVLEALLDLARMVGALDDQYSAVLSVKGEANSLSAYLYGLDKAFRVNGHQAVYLALGDDHPSQRLIERLKDAPFVVAQASYVSPVTEMADVVLPSEMWAEQEGHFLNLEGRLQAAYRGLTPPEEIRSHVDILDAIASQLDLSLDKDWQGDLSRRVSINPIQG